MKQHGIFFMLYGTAWNCMKTVSWCMELHETTWNCMKPHENHGHQLQSKKKHVADDTLA
jgi:hypothetical protein